LVKFNKQGRTKSQRSMHYCTLIKCILRRGRCSLVLYYILFYYFNSSATGKFENNSFHTSSKQSSHLFNYKGSLNIISLFISGSRLTSLYQNIQVRFIYVCVCLYNPKPIAHEAVSLLYIILVTHVLNY